MKLKRIAAAVSGLLLLGSAPAFGAIPGVAQPTVPSAVPSTATPNVFGGQVLAIARVGKTMVIGGNFTSVGAPGSSSGSSRPALAAFDVDTGALVPGFAPALDGEVDTIVPDPGRNAVYVGGSFKHANGTTTRIASINVATGELTAGFTAPVFNGVISDMQLGGTPQRLFVGGTFTTVAGQPRGGLATLNPTTGGFDPYLAIPLTENHNYGQVAGSVKGQVGAENVALNPAGNRLIVDGNFRKAGTFSRDQIVSITLGPTAAVQTNWNTNFYTRPCKYQAFDSYVRDVSWAPDGSYFVVATTGGGQAPCDTASRFNAATTGTAVTPVWNAVTGKDSLWSVAVTGTAVFVGGHQRWMNNPSGFDRAGAGAVPRPGLAALDPATGIPLAWNPGRNPRGQGTQVIYPTADGIWVGSDTDVFGSPRAQQYRRAKLAFFPLAGGYPPPPDNVGTAARIFEGGRSTAPQFGSRTFDAGTGIGGNLGTASAANQPAWGSVRGAFYLNGRVWYGYSDGFFYYRTFDGDTFGPAVKVDPYKDPLWLGVSTGSKLDDGRPILYDGAYPGFYGAQIKSVTAMFYANKAIYYTLSGKTALYKRSFSPDTAQTSSTQAVGGVIGQTQQVVKNTGFGSVAGMFVAGGKLWFAKTDGKLYKIAFRDGVPTGAAGVVTAGKTGWNARAVFMSPS